MTIHRDIKRHPEDPRIAIVDTLGDIPTLWQERSVHDVHGVICRYPATADIISAAGREIASRSKRNPAFETLTYQNLPRRGLEATLSIMPENPNFLSTCFQRASIDGNARHIISRLIAIFASARQKGNDSTLGYVRVNDDSVGIQHAHGTFMSFSFTQAGLNWCTGDHAGAGKKLELRPGEVGMFDDEIWHGSPEYKWRWGRFGSPPRVSLVLV